MEKTNGMTDKGKKWLDTLEKDDQGRYVVRNSDAYDIDTERLVELSSVSAAEIGDAVLVVKIDDDLSGIVTASGGGVFASASGAKHLVVGPSRDPLIEIVWRSFWTIKNAESVRNAVIDEINAEDELCAR